MKFSSKILIAVNVIIIIFVNHFQDYFSVAEELIIINSFGIIFSVFTTKTIQENEMESESDE